MTQSPIAVVGSLMADVFVQAPRLPLPGAVVHGDSVQIDGGGKGANQAHMAARMGWPVTLVGCVGQDVAGAGIVTRLSAAGVDTTHVLQTSSMGTGMFVVVATADGQRGALAVNGANGALRVEDIEQRSNVLQASSAVITQLEIPVPVAQAALRIAAQAGVLTVFNAAPRFEFPREMLAGCDYVVVNEDEARWLTGIDIRDMDHAAQAATRLQDWGARNALVTLGERGVWVQAREWQGYVPPFAMQVVDVLGAGDAFVGAFTVRVCEGAPAREAARFATAAAALSVTRRGAQSGTPARDEVEALLRQALA